MKFGRNIKPWYTIIQIVPAGEIVVASRFYQKDAETLLKNMQQKYPAKKFELKNSRPKNPHTKIQQKISA